MTNWYWEYNRRKVDKVMIVNCRSCNSEIEIADEFIDTYEEMGCPNVICEDCEEGLLNTQQDRIYDERVGK